MSETPTVPGHVAAWRIWRIVDHGRELRLRSPFGPAAPEIVKRWPTDAWLEASCVYGCETVPGVHCTCGVYAAASRASLASFGYHRPALGLGRVAIGEVALAGLVIPGTRGYRAARARPLRLLVPYDAWHLVDPLRRAYGVPVELANILEEVPHGHRP